MTFYTDMQNIAADLVQRYGATGNIVQFDPVTDAESVLNSFIYVQTVLGVNNIPDTIVSESDVKIFVPDTSNVPQKNQFVRLFNNILYKVLETEEYRPADKSIIHAVYLKK